MPVHLPPAEHSEHEDPGAGEIEGKRSPNMGIPDLPADLAAFMADAQVPWSVGARGGAGTDPAWQAKPSWYLVATRHHPASVGTDPLVRARRNGPWERTGCRT
jgi:hypothetical protein